MRELLTYLKKNVPYYFDHIVEHIDENIDEVYVQEIFKSIPIIDRSFIKQYYEGFIATSFPRNELRKILSKVGESGVDDKYIIDGKEYWVEYTSGTTGTPLPIIKSINERLRLGMSVWKMRQKFSQIKPEQMFCFMHNREGEYPFPFPFDENNRINRKINELKYLHETGYKWWHIFPAQLESYSEFHEYFDNSKGALEVIECNGAHVSSQDMKRYTELFKCKIANNYGCRELWNIAYSCTKGQLHINEDNVIFELVDDNGKLITQSNQVGEIVITSKNLKVMPFIRYKIGDFGYYEENDCQCRNNSKRICLDTNRNKILDTNLCGTDLFRSVILDLDKCFGINKFEAINIIQRKPREFIVNVKKFEEEKEIFEESFIKCANNLIKGSNKYLFEYNNDKKFKSIFVAV